MSRNTRVMRFTLLLLALFLIMGAGTLYAQEVVTINIAVKSATEVVTYRKAAEGFMKENPHIKIVIDELGRDGYTERIRTLLLTGSSDIDIVNFTNGEVGAFAKIGVIENLMPYFDDPQANTYGITPDMFLDGPRTALSIDGDMYALPYGTSTLLLYYRTDLIENPPKTWDEFLEIAKQFTKSYNPNSPTEYGTTIQGKRQSTAMREFAAYLWSFGGDIFDQDGRVVINSPESKEALAFWVDLYRQGLVPPDVTSYEYGQVVEAFQQGKVAMVMQWDAAAGTFANAEQSPLVYDKLGVAMAPGKELADGTVQHVPYLQSWAFAINTASQHKKEAFQFLSYFNTPEKYLENMHANDSTALKDVLEAEGFKEGRVHYEAYKASLQHGRAFPSSHHMDRIQNILDFSLARALSGEQTVDQAMETAAREIQELLDNE